MLGLKGEVLYNQYHKLVRERAGAYLSRYSANKQNFRDEMVSDGFLVMMNCARTYNPKRGSQFSTYLQHSLNNKMWEYIIGVKQRCSVFRVGDDVPQKEDDTFLIDLNDSLSQDSRFVVNIILTSWDNAIYEETGKITKRSLTIYLTKYLGWSFKRVWIAFDEIKYYLRCRRA